MARWSIIVALTAAGVGLLGCGSAARDSTPERAQPPAVAKKQSSAADFYLAPDGDDRAECSKAAPCRTWATAYAKANPGALIELAGGRYGNVELTKLPRKADPKPVVFRPAEGAEVKVGDLDVNGTSDVEII